MIIKTLHTRHIIEGNEPIWAVKYNGLYYVAEGNHRSRIAQLCRQRRIAARLVRVPEDIELTPRMFFAISMIIGSRQPVPRHLSWVDNITNVHRSLKEAERHRISAIAQHNSKQQPENWRLTRTSIGKVLFGPSFSKLSQDACVDPRRLNVDPIFNHSEAGRVFWTGAVRLIQAGIMDKLDALKSSKFKLQTKHLRLAVRLSNEHLQRAFENSATDPSFTWETLMVEATTQDSQDTRLIREKSSLQPRTRLALCKQSEAKESRKEAKRVHKQLRPERLSLPGSLSRKKQGFPDANVKDSAAKDAGRGTIRYREDEACTHPTKKRLKLKRISAEQYVQTAHGSPSITSKTRARAIQKPKSHEARNRPTTETCRTEEDDTVQPVEQNEVKLRLLREEYRTPEQAVSEQVRNAKDVADSTLTRKGTGVDKPESGEGRSIHKESENMSPQSKFGQDCAVIGCKMGPTSGVHKCQKCNVDVHPYCCSRILGQPPQQDHSDPIYCSKCWTPRVRECENQEESKEGDPELEKKRKEEDRAALHNLFKSLRQVECVGALHGNHDQEIKRDFHEIMTLTSSAIRLVEKIRKRIG